MTATDPDDKDAEITFAHAGGSENIEVYPTGDLVWKDPLPSYDSKTASNNVYKFTVEATSPGKVGPKTATQSITVTVTASGDLVVKLVVTPDSIAERESAEVTATLKSAAESSFTVEVDDPTDMVAPTRSAGVEYCASRRATRRAPRNDQSGRRQRVYRHGYGGVDRNCLDRRRNCHEGGARGHGQRYPARTGDVEAGSAAYPREWLTTSTAVTATIVGEAHDQDITVTVTADSPDAIAEKLMTTAWEVGTLTIAAGSDDQQGQRHDHRTKRCR